MRFYRSIRFRLILLYTTLLMLSLTAFGIFGYWRTKRDVIKTVDRALRAEFFAIGGIHEVDLDRIEEFTVEIDYQNQLGRAPWLSILVATPSGTVIARSSNAPLGRMLASPEGFQEALGGRDVLEIVDLGYEEPVRCLSRLVSVPDGAKYVVQIATSLRYQFKTLDNFVKNMIIGGTGFVAIATLLGWLIVNDTFNRVRRIRRVAEHISGANLARRLPVSGSEDEIDRLGQTFNRMIERIQSSFESVMRFTAEASHEIRTPISTMRSEVEQVLEKKRSAEEYERALASCLEEIEKLGGIADNLLTLARADLLTKRPRFVEVNLSEFLEGVSDIGRALAQQKNIEFKPNIPPLLVVRGDAGKLASLFTNLIDNAVRYTQVGGSVAMEAGTENGRVKVSVRDNGIGIEKSELPRIFDRFYRSERARAFSPAGSGLGLSICEAMAKEHGAKIDVESSPGKGSTFVVTFPPFEEEEVQR